MGVWVLPEPGLLSQCVYAMPWIVPVGRDRQASHPSAWPGLALSLFLLPVLFTATQQPLGTDKGWGREVAGKSLSC